MIKKLFCLVFALTLGAQANAFCGFYVGKADSKLFNEASQVVLVRDGDRTLLTMVNDYKGEMKEFALVVPVPSVLTKEQIHVTEKKYVDHLDAFTAPRLVEYFDDNPCDRRRYEQMAKMSAMSANMDSAGSGGSRAKALGVKIEAQYTVGEYDILILSAKESTGLVTWLKENKYKIPNGAENVLGSYIKQNLKFFVAKVNLKEQVKTGYTSLRPLQMAFESPRFMLPIRLGTVNANGPQDLIILALTRKGRIETTNYRTIKIPTGMNIPTYVRDDFGPVYKAIFAEQVKKEDMKVAFLEYAWDMSWCDPCAAEPLSSDELRELGVFWLDDPAADNGTSPQPMRNRRAFIAPPGGGAVEAFVTRLHVRYTADKFPDDLMFQETSDRENFQGRYVLQQPYKGEMKCEEAKAYVKNVDARMNEEAKTLASLTGWKIEDIRKNMKFTELPKDDTKWWEKAWKKKDKDK